jgi:molybdate transport system substrate-binding protein
MRDSRGNRARRRSTLLVGWAVMLLGCDPGAGPKPVAAAQATLPPHQLTVFATASLRRPFEALARRYEQEHAGAKVELRCEGGAQLLAAMYGGAMCDVVAIGDSSLMSRFAGAAFLAPGSPAELARNRIAIAVAAGNPRAVRDLDDLARPDLRVALGSRSASIGRHARWVLSHRPGQVTPSLELPTADDVLARVAAGGADAGIVYVTTFPAGDPRVERIAVPEPQNTPVLYSISATREAKEPRGAAAFRALALGPVGQQILADQGFLARGGS